MRVPSTNIFLLHNERVRDGNEHTGPSGCQLSVCPYSSQASLHYYLLFLAKVGLAKVGISHSMISQNWISQSGISQNWISQSGISQHWISHSGH